MIRLHTVTRPITVTLLFTVTLLCGLLLAQQQQPPQQQPAQPPPADGDTARFSVLTNAVQTPVWVYDRKGNYVDGLTQEKFRIFDNGREQNITGVDVAFAPISMVICVQANANVEKMLPAINKIGNLIQPHILGDAGEAAVIAYDSRVRTLQEFTHDGDKITAAVKKINPYGGSTNQHMVDAVSEATHLLQKQRRDYRRVILLIGERRDLGSEVRGREALIEMQLSNVTFYSINMSQLIEKLTAPAPDPRPDVIPPAAMPMPSNTPATPTTVMQTYGTQGDSAQFMPLLIEIYRDAKAIFKANTVDVFAKGTGGEEFSYIRGRGLEQAIEDMGEVLHTQYTITYTPNNADEPGFHPIAVDVLDPQAHSVRSRPGYWLGAK
ncbi:MAG: VWA domain-containing protein [Bryobacteraceae bacterium]|jgi:VWFA-related protein